MDETASVRASWDWLQEIFRNWVSWVREHLLLTLVLSTAAFAIGWIWNTYVMAVGLQGSQPGGQRTIATAEGETLNGLFWLLLFSLLSGLATYGWQRGWKQTAQDLAVLPRRFTAAFDADSAGTAALILWGAAVALVTASVITSAVSLALGLVLVTLAATPVGVILNFAVIRLWRGLTGVAAPEKESDAILVSAPLLVMVGEGFGLFVDWGLDRWLFSLVSGVVAGGMSLLLARRGQAVVTGMFVLGMVSLLTLADGRRAWADDGGWGECITDSGELCSDAGLGGFLAWFGSEGASTVLAYASIGGVSSAIGTAVGVGAGAAAAVVGAGPSASADRSGPPGSSAKLSGPQVGGTVAGSAAAASVQGAAEHDSDRRRSDEEVTSDEDISVQGTTAGATFGIEPAQEAGMESSRAALPDPPERSQAALPEGQAGGGMANTDAPGTTGSMTDHGASVPEFHDVLPEPPDRDEDEDEDEEQTDR